MAVLLAAALLPSAAQAWLVDDYPQFSRLVCSVIHNARDQGTPPPPLCEAWPFMRDPTLKTAVEEEKVLFDYGQIVRGCAEFARTPETNLPQRCLSGNDVCVAMVRQAQQSDTLFLGHLFHRAAWVWKSGTDTYSGSSHNCRAYGLDGSATCAPPPPPHPPPPPPTHPTPS